jgi:pimeloyl-ACP methyl ester carboxylesterase
VLVPALVLMLAFAFFYVGAFHEPTPDHVPVAVVGPPAVAAQLGQLPGHPHNARQASSRADALSQIDDREVYGAYEAATNRLFVASAANRATAIALEQTFDRAAAGQGRPAVRVTDVKPLPATDPNGTAAFYAVIAWVFGGYIGATLIGLIGSPRSSSRRRATARIGALAGFAIVAGILSVVMLRASFDTFSGHVVGLCAIAARAAVVRTPVRCHRLGRRISRSPPPRRVQTHLDVRPRHASEGRERAPRHRNRYRDHILSPRLCECRSQDSEGVAVKTSLIASIKPQFRLIDGVKIRYADNGGSQKPTLVLTSPWPESVYAFAPMWEVLSEHARLFAVDLPGFGASERRDDLLSPRAMGGFLAQLIVEAELGRPHIVAPDVGTSAALFAAAAHPERIASVIVGTGGAAVPIELGEPLKSWVLDPDLDKYRRMDPRAIVNAAIDTIAGGVPDDIRADYLACYDGDRFVESMRYARRYPEELPELAELLPQIATPVTIINGRHDRVVPVANAEFLDQRLPTSSVVLIDAGHFVWEEAPTEYASIIRDSITGNR